MLLAAAVCPMSAVPAIAQQSAKQTVNRNGQTFMIRIILQAVTFRIPSCTCWPTEDLQPRDLLMTEHFHPEYDSPLWRAEVLNQSMADSQFHAQVPPGPGLLQASGQQSLRPGLTAEEGLKGGFAINLGTSSDGPRVRDGEPAPP